MTALNQVHSSMSKDTGRERKPCYEPTKMLVLPAAGGWGTEKLPGKIDLADQVESEMKQQRPDLEATLFDSFLLRTDGGCSYNDRQAQCELVLDVPKPAQARSLLRKTVDRHKNDLHTETRPKALRQV